MPKKNKKNKIIRYLSFLIGLVIVSISFNLFILPNKIVHGGVSGIGVILNWLFDYDPAMVILIGSIFLLIMSFIFLGYEKTTGSILGSLLYPLFVKLTANIGTVIDLGNTEPLLLALFGAVTSGLGFGLVFKSGFTTGGVDILVQIISQYGKISMGNGMLFIDGAIIMSSVFIFGWTNLMYSLLTLYIISIMVDKVILGISQSKAFYIITDHETDVKRFITTELGYGVTVLEARGGYTGNREKLLMCVIPTKQYFNLKEGIAKIDKNAFFIIVDAYEVSGAYSKNY
jgi:uncharacterized membrane-anchored protein YitT (DUF2179 family)